MLPRISCLRHSSTGFIRVSFSTAIAVITLLVSYQLIGGWRAIYTKGNGPTKFDAILTIGAAFIAALLLPVVLNTSSDNKVIIFSTFGALALMLTYDSIRWLFPHSWYKFLWRYEHSYKLIASLFGMLSSFTGNVVRIGQPWTQIIPSVLGVVFIGYFFYKLYNEDRRHFLENENA